jgi:hypothetical protein
MPYLSFAAPHPATATSALTDPEKGLSYLAKGYSLKTTGTNWTAVSTNNESLIDTVRFASKDPKLTGSLSIRTDKIANNVTIETYAKKFMRDYPNYGFDVLGSKNIAINQSNGLVVDMIQKVKNTQLRQVILKNNNQVAILTCLDTKDNFMSTIASCNEIIKSFEWANSAPAGIVIAPASKDKTKVK